ncbi:tautomerase family protein [Planctomyces sp. SH-PL62]|uniref:tautomerase family protein n=1 Tax=Planctomyces sp. SH-PL62 TaxID=1636152 RepID=UPI0008380357|nr:tautomerase family protein [Planctomyces sp. SH-PL62]
MYTIVIQSGSVDETAKASLAAEITALHVELSAVPKDWVHVVFQEYAPGSGFNAGEAGPLVALTAAIRSGRSADYKHRLLTSLWTLVKGATGALDEQIVVGLQEVGPGQAMEMGRVMPEVDSNVS